MFICLQINFHRTFANPLPANKFGLTPLTALTQTEYVRKTFKFEIVTKEKDWQ